MKCTKSGGYIFSLFFFFKYVGSQYMPLGVTLTASSSSLIAEFSLWSFAFVKNSTKYFTSQVGILRAFLNNILSVYNAG